MCICVYVCGSSCHVHGYDHLQVEENYCTQQLQHAGVHGCEGYSEVWKRLAEVFPQMLPKGRVGAVDCSQEKELCSQLMGSKTASEGEGLPVIWRYGGGRQAGERWTGSLTSASLEELADFGSSKKGKSEL